MASLWHRGITRGATDAIRAAICYAAETAGSGGTTVAAERPTRTKAGKGTSSSEGSWRHLPIDRRSDMRVPPRDREGRVGRGELQEVRRGGVRQERHGTGPPAPPL